VAFSLSAMLLNPPKVAVFDHKLLFAQYYLAIAVLGGLLVHLITDPRLSRAVMLAIAVSVS
jgi:hypothetical protein